MLHSLAQDFGRFQLNADATDSQSQAILASLSTDTVSADEDPFDWQYDVKQRALDVSTLSGSFREKRSAIVDSTLRNLLRSTAESMAGARSSASKAQKFMALWTTLHSRLGSQLSDCLENPVLEAHAALERAGRAAANGLNTTNTAQNHWYAEG